MVQYSAIVPQNRAFTFLVGNEINISIIVTSAIKMNELGNACGF